MYVCMYVWTYTQTYSHDICMHTWADLTYNFICIYMYIYVYTHTNTLTYMGRLNVWASHVPQLTQMVLELVPAVVGNLAHILSSKYMCVFVCTYVHIFDTCIHAYIHI